MHTRRTIMCLILAGSFSLMMGCFPEDNKHTHHNHESMKHDHVSLNGDSIYHLDSTWTNRTGEVIKLKKLGGKVQVLAMVYSSCEYVCPRIVADMKKLESKLGGHSSHINFVLASFDPDRDKPKVLQEYSKKKGISKSNWYFISAPDESVLELAAVLGVKFKKLPDGEFSHSNVISIIDQNGVVKYQQVGLNQDPENSLNHIKKLLNQ